MSPNAMHPAITPTHTSSSAAAVPTTNRSPIRCTPWMTPFTVNGVHCAWCTAIPLRIVVQRKGVVIRTCLWQAASSRSSVLYIVYFVLSYPGHIDLASHTNYHIHDRPPVIKFPLYSSPFCQTSELFYHIFRYSDTVLKHQ